MSPNPREWRLEPHVCAICLGRVASRLVVERKAHKRPAAPPEPNGTLEGLGIDDATPAPVKEPAKPREVVTRHHFRCTDCGASWVSSVALGCACGIKVGARNAGIRCAPNPNRCPEMPSEFIAKEAV